MLILIAPRPDHSRRVRHAMERAEVLDKLVKIRESKSDASLVEAPDNSRMPLQPNSQGKKNVERLTTTPTSRQRNGFSEAIEFNLPDESRIFGSLRITRCPNCFDLPSMLKRFEIENGRPMFAIICRCTRRRHPTSGYMVDPDGEIQWHDSSDSAVRSWVMWAKLATI